VACLETILRNDDQDVCCKQEKRGGRVRSSMQ
jgi:hypothetical protein